MKRKSNESAHEFRKRKKVEKFRKEHRYDAEKSYWKKESKKTYVSQKKLIDNLFAGAGAAASSYSLYNAAQTVAPMLAEAAPYLPAVEEALGGEILADLLVPVAMSGAVAAAPAAAIVAGGAALGYVAGQALTSMFTQENTTLTELMPGTYQGKFALSAAGVSKGLRDKYQKKGAVYINETYGSIADPDICYIGQSTYNLNCIAQAIGIAIIRKLFRMSLKIDVASAYEVLPLVTVAPTSGAGDAFQIVYWCENAAGTPSSYAHPVGADATLYSIANSIQDGFGLVRDGIQGNLSNANPVNLKFIYLYEINNARLVGRLEMRKEKLSLAMSSHMVLQNRTKSATASESTTQVDVQPLKGPVYQFSSGVPKLKSTYGIPANNAFLNVTVDGLILVRGVQIPPAGGVSWKEPLVKGALQSVVKSGYTRLNPGALKSMTIGCDLNGYFETILFKLRSTRDATTISNSYGKSQLVMFEEELNSGSGNNITLSYECQHICGAELITSFSSNCQPGYESFVVNNLPE